MAIISPVQEDLIYLQELPGFGTGGVPVLLLRLDRVHPLISGNKWYKLRYNLEAARNSGARSVLTFGGAYSNHLIAAAAACAAAGLPVTGVVRGLHASSALTPVLQHCVAYGMQLVFVSREDYARKDTPGYLQELALQFDAPYIIPEGGANEAGRRGIATIAAMIPPTVTHVCVSVGSGTTFIGLRNALAAEQQLLGFAPMKGGSYLKEVVRPYLQPEHRANWDITDRFAFGGFGKCTDELRDYMAGFAADYCPLDRVYTGKMMAGLSVLMAAGEFPEGSSVLAVHTGGLSGN